MRAPLMGLALVIEMTGNYQLVLMTLFAPVVADITGCFWEAAPSVSRCLILPSSPTVRLRTLSAWLLSSFFRSARTALPRDAMVQPEYGSPEHVIRLVQQDMRPRAVKRG